MISYLKKLGASFLFFLKYGVKFRGEDVHYSFRCDNVHGLSLGRRVYIGPYCHFDALGGIEIDDFAIIGPHVKIWSYNHDFKDPMVPYGINNLMRPVKIGKGSWIGLGATILPGAVIGEGAIIGAGSVVKGIIPEYTMVRPTYGKYEPLQIEKDKSKYRRDVKE